MPHLPPRLPAHRAVRLTVILLALAAAGLLLARPGVQGFLMAAGAALFSHDPAVTHAWVSRYGTDGPLLMVLAFVVQAALPLVPAMVLTLVALLAYGPLLGFGIVYLGTLLGAVMGYGLGRGLGDPLIRTLVGERGRERAHAFAREQGVRGVILIRLMPVLSSDVMNLVAGATRMSFPRFMAATAAGALPVTLLVAWLVQRSAGSPTRLGAGLLLLSLLVGALALGRWRFMRWRAGRRGSRQAPGNLPGEGGNSKPG